jgi:hypothetical protein
MGVILTYASPCGDISFTDICALFIIFFAARGSWLRHPGISTLLQTILRDATIYFLLMFACQLVLLFFLFLAPVGRSMVDLLTPLCSSRRSGATTALAWDVRSAFLLDNE